MINLTINGSPFEPAAFEQEILSALKEGLHEELSSIRHPGTGEFPVVHVMGSAPDDVSATVEGSAELLRIIQERLDGEKRERLTLIETTVTCPPRAFLSYGWEDREVAHTIANALQANGIETWWAQWEILAGDSLRRKIEEGLSNCTIFLVLLTETSIKKPWVNQEIDAGLIRMIEEHARFIPVRKNLPTSSLSPLLRGMLSPELQDLDKDIKQLVADIHGISRKPPLGQAPLAQEQEAKTGYSAAATAVARLFVEETEHARRFDAQIAEGEICARTGLSDEDVADAFHELRNMLENYHGTVIARPELFVEFDKYFKAWDPALDALRVAADLVNDGSFPSEPDAIAERYGWEPRRLNPALTYLITRKLVQSRTVLSMGPWVAIHFRKTDDTRRFVKSRR